VTLIVPGFNDSDEELTEIARFLAAISPDIPWHVTAFHSDYKMMTTPGTSVSQLLRAVEIGRNAGLSFVYAGNLPGQLGDFENTRCAQCHELIIERMGFRVLRNLITAGNSCPKCGTPVPGFWNGAH